MLGGVEKFTFASWYIENQFRYGMGISLVDELDALPHVDVNNQVDVKGSDLEIRLLRWGAKYTVTMVPEDNYVFEFNFYWGEDVEDDSETLVPLEFHMEAILRNDPLTKLLFADRDVLFDYPYPDDDPDGEEGKVRCNVECRITQRDLAMRINRRIDILNERIRAVGWKSNIEVNIIPNKNSLDVFSAFKTN